MWDYKGPWVAIRERAELGWPPETGDALPLNLPLDLDVMTVHHSDYYLGQPVPAADWDSPVPFPFASARGSYLLALTGPPDWRNAAFTILKEALDHDGAGAKTAAGYGRLDVSPLVSASSPEAWEGRVREITMAHA